MWVLMAQVFSIGIGRRHWRHMGEAKALFAVCMLCIARDLFIATCACFVAQVFGYTHARMYIHTLSLSLTQTLPQHCYLSFPCSLKGCFVCCVPCMFQCFSASFESLCQNLKGGKPISFFFFWIPITRK